MPGFETLPIRAEIYIPENKLSAWVSKNGQNVVKDGSKEHQGVWVVEEYTLDKRKASTEIWIFYDNDELGIDDRVLENNPLRGTWGYAPKVDPRKAEIQDMWFFPPKSARCKIPSNKEEYNHKGTWVKPTFKRDFSQLGKNSSGFMNVSGNMRIAKGEKHSIGGTWNMLGFNDDIVRGKKKPKKDDSNTKGPWTIYVRKHSGSRFPISVIPGKKISDCKTKILAKKGIPIKDQRLSFHDVPLKDVKTIVGSGIRNGDTIDLGPTMIIYVQPLGEESKIQLDVEPTDTLKSVKLKVKNHLQMPISDQRLSFNETEMLTNSKNLQSYNVHHLDTLFMLGGNITEPKSDDNKNHNNMIIFIVKEWNNHKFKLRTEPTNTILDVKKMIEASENIPVDQQRLAFKKKSVYNSKTLEQSKIKNRSILHLGEPKDTNTKSPKDRKTSFMTMLAKRPSAKQAKSPGTVEIILPDTSKIIIPVQPSSTFSDIKDHIEKTNGIPRSRQRIFFLDDEENEPDDISPLLKTNLSADEPIVLKLHQDPENFEVKTPDGRSFFFDFDPADDTIEDLKSNIAKTIRLPVKEFELFDSNGDIVDENTMPSRGEVLTVAPHVDIEMPDKSKIRLCMLPKMTIDELKDVIEEKTGTPKAEQRIFFFDSEGDELDDTMHMGKAGIKPGSVLEMRPPAPEEEKIAVRSPDGRSFSFDFDPVDDTIEVLKSNIAKTIGLPVKEFELFDSNGDIVDENTMPSRCDILDVAPHVYIELPDKSKIRLCMLPQMTIDELKDAIEEKTGTPKAEQRIFFFDSEGDELDDSAHMGRAGIKPGSVLEMRPPAPEEEKIAVRSPDSRSFPFDFDQASNTDHDVKTNVARQFGMPIRDLPPLMKEPKEISIKDPSGRIFKLFIDPHESVRDVKKRIREKIGIPIGGFKLDDKVWDDIDDDIPLDDAGFVVRNGGILEIDPPEIEIALPNSKKIKLKILPTMTVRDVKKIVEEEAPELFIGDKKQRMFFLDDSEELEDDDLFEKLKFDNGQTLEMRSMMINVQNGERGNFELDVQTDWYIDDVRDRIHLIANIPPEQQYFLFNGEPVKEDTILIKQGIVHNSTLILEPMSINVNIPLRKKPVRFVVKRTDTVNAVKRKALKKIKKEKTGSSRNYCILVGGQELANNETLEMYDVQHDDLLTLEEFKLRIMHWSGDIIDLDGVRRNATVSALKKQIHEIEGIPMDDQRLSLDGRRLEDKNTLKEEKLKHRTVLVLEGPDADIEVVKAEKRNVKTTKMKKFKSKDNYDEIMPVMPDWTRRIFIFDFDDKFDAHIELVIMHWTGEKFTLKNILLKRKISSIKTSIFKLKGIKKKNQIIKFDGEILDDKRTLLEQNVGHRSILVLESPKENTIATPRLERLNRIFSTVPTKLVTDINIKVRHWNGETFDLSPAINDYIDDVKDLIYDLKKIPLDYLLLSFQGQPTQDDMNLNEHGIVDGSMLVLEPMRIFLQLPTNKESFALDVDMNQKIYDVKKSVAMTSNLPFESLCLMIGGDELDDSKTIFECGVEHEDEIRVETFEIKVMHWSGQLFSVNGVSPNDTTYDVKSRISKMVSVSIEQQILTLKGQILNDVLRLKDQDIHHKTVLMLDPPDERVVSPVKQKVSLSLFNTCKAERDMIVDVTGSALSIKIQHWNGKTFFVDAEPTEYIDDLKERLFSTRNIPVDQQRLEFRGQLLSDDITIADQGIDDNSTIIMRKMKVFISVPGNDVNVDVEVDPEDSILKLKNRFRRKTKIPTEGLCLMLAGEELSDTKQLSHYNIDDQEVLLLEPFKVKVLDWNGHIFEVDGIHHNSTVEEFKGRINQLKSIPQKEQVLKLDNLPVIDSLRLGDQGIHHASIVVLDTASGRHRDSESLKSPKVTIQVSKIGNNKIRYQNLQKGGDIDSGDDSPSLGTISTKSSTITTSLSSKGKKLSKEKRKGKSLKAKRCKAEKTTNEKMTQMETKGKSTKRKKDSKKKEITE